MNLNVFAVAGLARHPGRGLNATMGDRDEFLRWFDTAWRDAEVALHNGDAGPRFETWSERAPVTLFGAWRNAEDPAGAREVFRELAQAFSQATSSEVELIAADASGDLAYTVQREITSTIVNGEPRQYVLRVTQVYRREDGNWKVVHRHGDEELGADKGP
ncbi:nuclear transport factor 2 family protein [Sinomonas sp. P10A9]|uniref:Nuclear transport factor 2 family protein n=1 Tax=Sinomonas puerhi TaxID=3238584 RepID=A0AB39L2X0_9MICC